MRNTIDLHRFLKGLFWSLVYVVLILYVSKILFEVLSDLRLKSRIKDWHLTRRIIKAMSWMRGYDNGNGPPWQT